MGTNRPSIERALAAGLDFILAQQSPEGSWTDWDLPPGSSSTWTTAYVGARLSCLPESLKARAAPSLTAAARWLLDNEFAEGGWGYNQSTGVDADSTAWAIRFLASVGCQVPQSAYKSLIRHQNPDGGFCTYLPEGNIGSWGISHPDVTPVALMVWLTQSDPDRRVLELGIQYVLGQQTEDGTWPSFWWDSWLYATEVSLAFLKAVGVKAHKPPSLSDARPTNPFETALLLSIWLYLDPAGAHSQIDELVGRLIREQQPDGGWASAPILRITRREVSQPWDSSDPGHLYPDPKRLFTSATALHALTRAIR